MLFSMFWDFYVMTSLYSYNGNGGDVIQFGVCYWWKLHSILTVRKTVHYTVWRRVFYFEDFRKSFKTKEHCLVFSLALQTLLVDSNKWYREDEEWDGVPQLTLICPICPQTN